MPRCTAGRRPGVSRGVLECELQAGLAAFTIALALPATEPQRVGQAVDACEAGDGKRGLGCGDVIEHRGDEDGSDGVGLGLDGDLTGSAACLALDAGDLLGLRLAQLDAPADLRSGRDPVEVAGRRRMGYAK